jgi:hypothetical protein
MSSDELENTKNKTLETQIIQLMKGFQQPVPLGVFYRCFPKYNDRTIRAVVSLLVNRGIITDSKRCQCGNASLYELKRK